MLFHRVKILLRQEEPRFRLPPGPIPRGSLLAKVTIHRMRTISRKYRCQK